MAAPQKDTIYIDVDDEITSIIEKVQDSQGKVIALVLPKRATVFQSVVNMKLLKRSASAAKKHVVLITSEAGLLPLAGSVGIHVSKTLQSKPEVPDAPVISDAPVSVDDPSDESELDFSAPVGELASEVEEEPIQVDNDGPIEIDPDAPSPSKKLSAAKSLGSKFKVPDFNKFRVRVVLGVLVVVLLITGWVMAFIVMPKAQVVIKTNDTSVNSSLTLVASTSVKKVEADKLVVPSEIKQLKKSDTIQVTATGQKDVGTKATGKVTMTTKIDCGAPAGSVAAGTTVSSSSLSYITQDVATFAVTSLDAGKCVWTSNSVAVVSEKAGDQYNLSARNYSVAGNAGVSAAGTAMTGGTSKVVTIVAQSDLDGAKQKFIDNNNTASNQALVGQLKSDGYLPLLDTFNVGDALITSSPNVGDEAANATITVAITYSMSGAQQGGVKQLLEADIKKHIDSTKQNILNNGLDKAVIHITSKAANGDLTFTLQSTATAGVQQNVSDIKKIIVGKKKGEVQSLLSSRPGVKDVTVNYSPFWVYSTPKSADKITIVFQKSDGSTTNGQ